jgi:hypothetical protein
MFTLVEVVLAFVVTSALLIALVQPAAACKEIVKGSRQ